MTKRNCTTTPTFTPYPPSCIPRGLAVLDMADDLLMVLQHDGPTLATVPEEFKRAMGDRLAAYQTELLRVNRLLDVAMYRLNKATI